VFLGCRCPAKDDLEIEPVDFMRTVPGQIESVEGLSDSVLQLKVRTHERLKFQAGQVIHLVRPSDGLSRPYAVASLPEDPCLELYVERHPQGAMSAWLANAQGEQVVLRGSIGDFFYTGERTEPLLLIASGVGAAAMLGVLRAALQSEHKGPIHVLHCASSTTQTHFRGEFERMASGCGGNVRFSQLVEEKFTAPSLEQALFQEVPDLRDFRVYLAGDPSLVRRLKRKTFSRGAKLDKIHHFPFKCFRISRTKQVQRSD
jgi:ferredoxin-NADP reductase